MSGKKNLNDASKEELITIVKQLHSKLQQQQQSHPATTTTTTSSSAGVSSSSQQLQHEFEERLNSLAEQVKLLKGELAATQKEKANLSREFAKLSEKSQADEETIQSLIQQVETMASNVSSHHQAPSTSTPSSSSMLQAQQLSSSHTVAAGATHAKVAPSSLSSSSTSHSNSNNSNIASSETHQVMREAMEGMKAHVRELESALHQAQEKLNEQTEWMRFQRAQDVLLKRLVHEDPQQQEGENADTVNNVVPSQQAPEAASASIQSSIVDEEEIRELKTKLRQLRVDSEVQQRLTESERLEVQRLMAINVNLQRQVQLLSQLSSNNNGLIKDTQHNLFAGLRNGGGGPDGGLASLSNSFRQPFPPHPQQQQPGGAGSTTEKSSVGGGGGGGPLVSSSTPPNAMSRTSVDDGTAAPQLAQPQQATLLMHSSSRRSLAASSTDGSSAQLQQQQQQQQQHVASSALLPAGLQTPTRTLSNVASPMAGFVKTLPVIQLRGVTPRERKLLDRIKLLEDHVQSCDAFEAMRKQRIDEAERNRAEIMVAMQRQVDSLRHELSSLKQQQKQQQQQPPLQAVVVTVVHEDGTAAASMEQQQQPAAAAATTSIPDRQLEAAALLSPPLPPAPPTYQDPLVVTPPPQSFESSDFSVEQTVSASPRSAAVEEPLCTLKELEERDAAIATLTQTIQTLEAERAEREDRFRSAVKIVQAIKQREAEAIQKCQEQDILLEQGNEALEAAQHALNTEKSNCLQAQSLCSMYEAAWRDSCSWCESVMAEVTPLLVDRHRSPSYSSTSTSTVGCGTSSSPLLLLLDVQKGAETKSLFEQQSPSSHSGVTQAPAEDLLAKQLQADLEMIRRRVLLKANDDDDDEEDKGRERRVAGGNTRTHTANGQFDRLLPKEESFAAVALPTEGGGGVAQRPQPSRQPPPSNDVVLSESATVPSLITENVSTKKEEHPDVAAASNSAVAFDFFAAFSPPPPPVASSVMTGTTGIAAPPPRPSTSFADFDPFA